MEIGHLIPHIEALIFASDKPLTALELTELINNAFGFMEDKIVLDQVESALEGIVEKYRSEFYPFEVRESGGGWQFLTKRDYHKTVAQLNGDKFLKRLSTAALEALSIIAYKQPVTKAEIEAIRGVSSDYAIQKLLEKELIVITGRNEKLPGHPLVYGTSKNFMDYFGINSAEDLPKLKEVFDEAMVNATNVNEAMAGQEKAEGEETGEEEAGEATVLAVGENGELIEGMTGTHLNGEAVEFGTAEGTGEEGDEEEATDTEMSAGNEEAEETGEEAAEEEYDEEETGDDEETADDNIEEEETEEENGEEEEEEEESEEDDQDEEEEEDEEDGEEEGDDDDEEESDDDDEEGEEEEGDEDEEADEDDDDEDEQEEGDEENAGKKDKD